MVKLSSVRVLSVYVCTSAVFQLAPSTSIPVLTVPPNAVCACPIDVLTYECFVVGGASTQWRGSVLDCPNIQNLIVFRHSEFLLQSLRECNNGLVNAKPLYTTTGDTGIVFVSQLNISMSAALNNKTLECHGGENLMTSDTSTVIVISESYPPPHDVRLADVSKGKLIFSWNAVNKCPSVDYLISAEGCGTCPNSTNQTNLTCATDDLSLNNTPSTCTVRIQSQVCGYISNDSSPTLVTLIKVPDAPSIRVVPRYFHGNRSLASFQTFIKQVDYFNFTNEISGSPTHYNIISVSSNGSVNQSSVPACEANTCDYTSQVESCSADMNITVLATNKLGELPPTEAITIDCMNKLVQIEFYPSTSTISCIFTQQNSAEKSFNVTYSDCDQGPAITVISPSTRSDTVSASLDVGNFSQLLCFTASTINGNVTVEVTGEFDLSNPTDGEMYVHIIAPIVVIVIVVTALVVIIISVVVCWRKISKQKMEETDAAHQSIKIESVVRGYHVYKKHWTPIVGEVLSTKREPHNKHDSAAVAVINKSGKVVGHIPKDISKYCSAFIELEGKIKCEVKGEPKNQELTMNKDKVRLEVPCTYVLSCKDENTLELIKSNVMKLGSSVAKVIDNEFCY